MSYNSNDVPKSARRHIPALIGIAVALLAVVVIFMVLRPDNTEDVEDGIAVTPPPEGTPLTDAEGIDGQTGTAPDAAPGEVAPTE